MGTNDASTKVHALWALPLALLLAASCGDDPEVAAACGAVGQACCAGDTCAATNTCEAGTCVPREDEEPCGALGQACCDAGDACTAPHTCDAGTCVESMTPPGDDETGTPCNQGSECSGLLCLSTGNGQLCTEPCTSVADCPTDWDCGEVLGQETDVCICVPSAELCDGLDNDCDGEVDNAAAVDADCDSQTPGDICVDGACECQHVCQGSCTDIDVTVEHCGGCDMPCAAPPASFHAIAACAAGMCTFTCEADYADCDGNAANGCETNLLNDDDHCGECGYACLVGSCMAGVGQCPSTVIGAPFFGPQELAINDTDLFILDQTGNVRRHVLGSSTHTILTQVGSSFVSAPAIDADYLYATPTGASASPRRIALSNFQSTVYSTGGAGQPREIAVDSQYLFFTEPAGLQRMDKNVTTGVTPMTTGSVDLHGVATDGSNVFFLDNTAGTLSLMPVVGGAITELASGLSSPLHLVLFDGQLYWSEEDAGAGSLYTMPVTGGTPTQIGSAITGVFGDIAVDSTSVYWAVGTELWVWRKDDSALRMLTDDLFAIRDVAVIDADTDYVYFTTPEGGSVLRVPK